MDAMVYRWGSVYRVELSPDADQHVLCIKLYNQRLSYKRRGVGPLEGMDSGSLDSGSLDSGSLDAYSDSVSLVSVVSNDPTGSADKVYDGHFDMIVDVLNAYGIGAQFVEYIRVDPVAPDPKSMTADRSMVIPLNLPCAGALRVNEWIL
jgi:hypothetical protein